MYNQRVCNPLWPTFGCRTRDPTSSNTVTTAPTESEPAPGSEAWYDKFFGWFSAESEESFSPRFTTAGMIVAGIGLVALGRRLRGN
jgi:hypothetical protein